MKIDAMAEIVSVTVAPVIALAGLLLLLFAAVSLAEGERHAARRAGVSAIMVFAAAAATLFLPPLPVLALAVVLILFVLAFLLSWVLPAGRVDIKPQIPQVRVDERDIPFSRIRLRKGSREYQLYYGMHPENLQKDERMRKLPGLLSPDAAFADEVGFAAARASFDFIETFRDRVEPQPAARKSGLSPAKLTWAVKALARYYGARSVGICKLQDYHIYSHIGRGSGRYGDPVRLPHTHAVAFTVEMAHRMIRCAPRAPAVMESARQYVEAARVAMQLAMFLSELGYEARAHIDSNYRVIASLVARDAGLGEFGRMGLLMTPELGPRVRIGVVTTNAPLHTDSYRPDATVLDFCRICLKCAENCPSKAIPFGERQEVYGNLRWQIDADKCFGYWNVVGTDCGVCMAVCPYSHPDNFLHRAMRKFVKTSGLARRFALLMDDFFYGRKPQPFSGPDWIGS